MFLRRPALTLALAAVLLLAPSLILGTLQSDSAPQNLTWGAQFSEQFRAGVLYPRWMPESFDGLGSPAFYFYPPLAFWIDALLSVVTHRVLSVSHRLSIAALLLLWGSGLAMYAWLRALVNGRIALIGALGYMAAPYHLVDYYIRGAYAEFAAYAALPLLALGIRRVADGNRNAIALLAAAYAALILAHLPTALLASVTVVAFYGLFCAWRTADRVPVRFLLRCALAGALGLGLAAIYLVPALSLQGAISADQFWLPAYRVSTWFLLVLPKGLIRPASIMLIIDSIAAACALSAVGVIAGLLGRKTGAGQRDEAGFWAALGLLGLLLMSGLVPWFWDVVPLVSKVQFPWRLLSVVEFATLTALCLLPWATLRRPAKLVLAAALIALFPGVGEMTSSLWARIELALNDETTRPQDVREYLPAHYPQGVDKGTGDLGLTPLEKSPLVACTPAARVCRAEQRPFGALTLEVDSETPTAVSLRRFSFPAWRLEPDLAIVATDPLRLVSFTAPAGRTSVRLVRRTMAEEKIGWAVSGLSLALLLVWLAAARRSLKGPSQSTFR